MKKHLLILSVLGFLLGGCGEKKITEDYLLGDWQCRTISDESAEFQGNKWEAYHSNKVSGDIEQLTVKKENDVLMFMFKNEYQNQNQSYSLNLDSFPKITQSSRNEIGQKVILDYVRMSDTQFQRIVELEIYGADSSPWTPYEKKKTIIECNKKETSSIKGSTSQNINDGIDATLWKKAQNDNTISQLHVMSLGKANLYMECDEQDKWINFFYFDENEKYYPLSELIGITDSGHNRSIKMSGGTNTFRDVVSFFNNVDNFSFKLDSIRKSVSVVNNKGSGSLSSETRCEGTYVYAARPDGL